MTPGTLTVSVPPISAAIVPVPSSARPWPPVSETIAAPPLESAKLTLLSPMRTTVCALAVVVRSSEKSPVSVWPTTVSDAPVTSTRR